jgi:aminoglycoside phosphotransferase family enzyme
VTVIVSPRKASPELLAPLSDLISKNASIMSRGKRTKECYAIDQIQKSESAWILFAHRERREKERYVIKLLCHYNDRRYHLESLLRRQQCQIEALNCNSIFSPNVYVGLANAYQLRTQQLVLGRPTRTVTDLDQHTEYALVMRELPSKRRLDYLLEHSDEGILQQYVQHLVMRIVDIHNTSPTLSFEESRNWGGFPNLQLKLEHNLSLADLLFDSNSSPSFSTALVQRFANLKAKLAQIFALYPYPEYFNQRSSKQHIKHCHGDLKGPNIWIEPFSSGRYQVAILDAIDFNPMYSNIDTLSDFATLVVDIQTRLRCTPFAHQLTQKMIKQYLLTTGQYEDEAAHAVLHFYLVEKAFVGAAISIVYDDLSELGEHFLEVAETSWHDYFAAQLPKIQKKAVSEQNESNFIFSL